MTETRTCGDAGGRKEDGSPCRSTLGLGAEGLCLFHDPLRRSQALEARRAGARGRAEKLRKEKAARPDGVPAAPRSLEDAEEMASWISRAVLVGEIHPRVAEAATKAVRQFQLKVEKRELQDRVKELERALRQARA